MTMAPRPCTVCGQLYAPSKGVQRFCSTACRGKSQEWLSRGREAKRDQVAPSIVRGWSPAQRERARWLLTQSWWTGPAELGVVALIDKVTAEEAR